MAIPVQQVISAFDAMIQGDGSDCTFTLRGGAAFTIKGVLRFTSENDLTAGLVQDNKKLSVMAHRWEKAVPVAGRIPEKGDQVTIDGHRYAIDEVNAALVSNVRIGWRITLRG